MELTRLLPCKADSLPLWTSDIVGRQVGLSSGSALRMIWSIDFEIVLVHKPHFLAVTLWITREEAAEELRSALVTRPRGCARLCEAGESLPLLIQYTPYHAYTLTRNPGCITLRSISHKSCVCALRDLWSKTEQPAPVHCLATPCRQLSIS